MAEAKQSSEGPRSKAAGDEPVPDPSERLPRETATPPVSPVERLPEPSAEDAPPPDIAGISEQHRRQKKED